MPALDLPYRMLMGGARLVAPLLAAGDSKLARGIRGRAGAVERLRDWARSGRVEGRPLVWVHAPSVGEGLQARAVVRALKEAHPDCQVAYTHFSPSVAGFPMDMPADVTDYLPWDVSEDMGAVLEALSPSLLVFTKTEVWPVLAAEAARRSIPVALVAGTLRRDSGRAGAAGRALLGPAMRSLRMIAAVGEQDAARFARIGVPRERITVTGDPGIDAAVARAAEASPEAHYLRPFRAATVPVLVAGSTWPADEEALLEAATALRARSVSIRLVIAPHEPSEIHLNELAAGWRAAGWSSETLTQAEGNEATEADVVLVDRVGILAQLYAAGVIGYVGGGFGRRGLHSVLEPAAHGLPVLFGPHHTGSAAAVGLLDAGGALAVGSAEGLADALERWVRDPDARVRAGDAARAYLMRHRGAARRTGDLLAPFLAGPP